jgi:hypothetical protein
MDKTRRLIGLVRTDADATYRCSPAAMDSRTWNPRTNRQNKLTKYIVVQSELNRRRSLDLDPGQRSASGRRHNWLGRQQILRHSQTWGIYRDSSAGVSPIRSDAWDQVVRCLVGSRSTALRFCRNLSALRYYPLCIHCTEMSHDVHISAAGRISSQCTRRLQ